MVQALGELHALVAFCFDDLGRRGFHEGIGQLYQIIFKEVVVTLQLAVDERSFYFVFGQHYLLRKGELFGCVGCDFDLNAIGQELHDVDDLSHLHRERLTGNVPKGLCLADGLDKVCGAAIGDFVNALFDCHDFFFDDYLTWISGMMTEGLNTTR